MKQPMTSETKKLAIFMLLNSVLFVVLYFVIASFGFPIQIVYLVLGTALGLWYVIYNRGFAGKGATPDMLPPEMSYEEKLAFLEDCKSRLHRSRWALTFIFPIILALSLDMMYLFLLPMLGVVD